MWQAPNQRVKAAMNARKRARERNKKPMHVKRVRAQVKILQNDGQPPIVNTSRIVLNDISPTGLGLFSAVPVLVGQEVAITLEEPKRVYLKGRIVWCQEYAANSHVLSKESYAYRLGVQFLFESEDDREAIKRYCEEMKAEHLYGTPGTSVTAAAKAGGGSEGGGNDSGSGSGSGENQAA